MLATGTPSPTGGSARRSVTDLRRLGHDSGSYLILDKVGNL